MLNRDPKKRLTPFDILAKKQVIQKMIMYNSSRRSVMKMGGKLSKKYQFGAGGKMENCRQGENGI